MTLANFTFPSFPHTKHLADINHYMHGRKIWPPKTIILHATASNSVNDDSREWLAHTSPLSNPVSCHVLISRRGEIVRIVEDDHTAWHAGYGVMGKYARLNTYSVNDISLGLELENTNQVWDTYPETQLFRAAQMVVYWWGLYGYLPINKHKDIDSRKNDPEYFPDMLFGKYLNSVLRTSLI